MWKNIGARKNLHDLGRLNKDVNGKETDGLTPMNNTRYMVL
jgi:hypothetical protein